MIEHICGIYKIQNKVDNKTYIGKSSDIYTRWYNHKNKLKSGSHENSYLQNAWNKYGAENFLFEVLEISERSDHLPILESYWISYLDCLNRQFGYNIESVSPNTFQKTISEETRSKLSLAGKGRTHSDITKRKMSNALMGNTRWLGKRHTDDTKNKISKAQKGKIVSEHQRLAMSRANKNRVFSADHRKNISQGNKKIYIIMDNDNNLLVFKGLHEFCKSNKLRQSSVSDLIGGRVFVYRGYKHFPSNVDF